MSLSWQKTKSGRFSRFMSEFQQSPKRCRSLVVETGFPTSIIHLFVKNRDRLKKSSSKRQPQTALNASPRRPIKSDVIPEREKANSLGGGITGENKLASEQNVCVCGGNGSSGTCVLIVFKVLIVAVLALSTEKKLTIGLTISALALLLTELVTARVLTRFKLCNTDKKAILSADSRDNCVEEIRVPKSDTKSISCPEETEPIVASNSKVLTIRDLLLKDEKSKSKSWGLKSKILKKLRSYKKKKKTMKIKQVSLTEVPSFVSEDKSERIKTKRDEERSDTPVIASKGDQTNGLVLIVIVLTGLVYGKFLATVLTLSCLVLLRFGVPRKF